MTNTTPANAALVSAPPDRTCPRCGLTETMLRTEGLLGCSTCYETFADLVAQAAAALHGVTLAPLSSPTINTASKPTLPPVTAPTPRARKTLSWLPRRTGAPDSKPVPPNGKKKRTGG